jgi:ATP-dependent Lon protease
MFPLEFDHTFLDSLPLPDDEDVQRVSQILKAIVARRVMPYFKKNRGTDPIAAARVMEHLAINRLEDSENRIRGVSLITVKEQEQIIHVHERVFDYLAFVIPSHPDSRLGEGTYEERKVLAFSEFMLRHEMDHLLYPQRSEREVIQADVAFAMDRRTSDPTYYRSLRAALSDEMNGLKGRPYLGLFDQAEQDINFDAQINDMLNVFASVLADTPGSVLQQAFPRFDAEFKTKVLGTCYRRSRDTAYSLLVRTSFLQKTLRLFVLVMEGDFLQAQQVFDSFKASWGLVTLLQELGVQESAVEGKSVGELFRLFKTSLRRFIEEVDSLFFPVPPSPQPPRPEPKPPEPVIKSLKDRIEDARRDPSYPPRVIEVIEKNKLNAVGHSGSKYSELIETLLSMPWGKIQTIDVTAEEFERGLERSHYGLRKPKETICDFFTNLIWRYRDFTEDKGPAWRRNGSAFLFVGPPGVGKTSLAISIAKNLRIPYHKLSLGGMRDEADLKGHGFTYEGSKPGAIVQGLIKMGIMNGMFIMDEADKTEKFAIATLLEILDPEQNYLYHDKYTETTIDIDLSNCHFMLTANTLETVPPAVINRCEVVMLDRYSVEEKISIAREHLIQRVREQYQIGPEQIAFDPAELPDVLRYLIKTYTHEAGVRELERLIRTLFLRIFRKEVLAKHRFGVKITREEIKEYLAPPRGPRKINPDDRVGEILALGVNVELGIGSVIPIQATLIELGDTREPRLSRLSMVHATGNIQKIMDESRKVATTAIFHCGRELGIDMYKGAEPIHLHFMGGSSPKDGPSAGGAIALALASVMSARRIRRDVAMTGEIDTHGRITVIAALDVKLETTYDAGCKTLIIPTENLYGEEGVERLSEALKRELQILTYDEWKSEGHEPFDHNRHTLQIVAVNDVLQAADIAFIDDEELRRLEDLFTAHALKLGGALAATGKAASPSLSVLYVKDAKELELENMEDSFWQNGGSVLLVRPSAMNEIMRRFPEFSERARVWEFDPMTQDLATVLQTIEKSVAADVEPPVRLSMFAPYFFLLKQGVCLEGFPQGIGFEGLRIFANNYTLQGIKIKGSKSLLNRFYRYLSAAEPEHVTSCPFLRRRDGICMVDLAFIPEKYRLDDSRAVQIVNKGLKKWLTIIESATVQEKGTA